MYTCSIVNHAENSSFLHLTPSLSHLSLPSPSFPSFPPPLPLICKHLDQPTICQHLTCINLQVLDGQLMITTKREATRGLQDELAMLKTAGSIMAGENEAAPIEVLEAGDGDGFGDAWCAGGEADSEQPTALMLVGVRTGTVENFAHFVWDYLLNLHRLLGASGVQPGQDGCCQVILHDSSIKSLYEHRPRKYYDTLLAVTGGSSDSLWQALKEMQDGTCLPRVILGFGTARRPIASTPPLEAHPLLLFASLCTFGARILRHAPYIQYMVKLMTRIDAFPAVCGRYASTDGSEAVLCPQVQWIMLKMLQV